MAVSLNAGDFGKLIDPFNGLADLKNKIIKTVMKKVFNISSKIKFINLKSKID